MKTETRWLNGIWRFEPRGLAAAEISVPSHWTHGQAWGYPKEWEQVEEAWLSRPVSVPARWKDREVLLHFGAVMLHAEVYAGEEKIGAHSGGFTPFEVALRGKVGRTFPLRVQVGSARHAVKEDALLYPVSYPENTEEGAPLPGGIWQNVALVARPRVHVHSWSHVCRVRDGRLDVDVVVRNADESEFSGSLCAMSGNDVFLELQGLTVAAGSEQTVRFSRSIQGLPLWSPEQPTLIPVCFVLKDSNGQIRHEQPERIGLREFGIEGDRFFLNGTPVKLFGFSLVGHRIAPQFWRRDYLRLLFQTYRKLGVNHVRSHASIVPPVVLDVADEMGLLVQNQSAIWSAAHRRYLAGGEAFLENAQREMAEWMARDRNHPSVVIWDVENELVRIDARNKKMSAALVARARELDPTRPVVASGAGAWGVDDVFHLHSETGMRVLIDRWRQCESRRPFVVGEWSPDMTALGVAPNWHTGGLHSMDRYPSDFISQDHPVQQFVALYRDEIIAQRVGGVGGTVPFMPETYLFHMPFASSQPVHVKATTQDPVAFSFAPGHIETRSFLLRNPYVNPGWVKGVPRVRFHPARRKMFQEAIAPVLVALRETAASAYAGATVERTVVVLNDTSRPLETTVFLYVGRALAHTIPVSLTAGGVFEQRVKIALPLRTGEARLTARWKLETKKHQRELQRLRLYRTEVSTKKRRHPVYLSNVANAVAQCVQEAGWDPVEGIPTENHGLWILGGEATPDAGRVEQFVRGGGRVIALRRESLALWVGAPLGFRSSIRVLGAALQGVGIAATNGNVPTLVEERGSAMQGLGLSAAGRECTGQPWVRILAPEHPVFRRWATAEKLGPWLGVDGRVADDLYLKPDAKKATNAGALTVLAGGPSMNSVSLAEVRLGKGALLLCQLCLESNVGVDAEATALLRSLLEYSATATSPVVAAESGIAEGLREHLGLEVVEDNTRTPVKIVSDMDRIHAALADLENESSALRARVAAGMDLWCVVPAQETPFPLGAWTCSPVGERRFLTSVVQRPRSLSGWTAADLDFMPSGSPSSTVMSLGEGEWEDAVLAWNAPRASLLGGYCAGECMGAVVKHRRIGRGSALVTTLDLARWSEPAMIHLWESLLTNGGVTLPRVTPLVAHGTQTMWTIHRTPELPLDGDYRKWTCEEQDKNLGGGWSRAEPILLMPSEGGASDPLRGRYAAVAYVMWSASHLYAAMALAAPEHAFTDRLPVYEQTAFELFVNATQVIGSADSGGRPRLYIHNVAEGTEASVRVQVTKFDAMPAWPDLQRLALTALDGLRVCFVEMAVPWKVLNMATPTAGEKIPMAVIADFGDPAKSKKRGALAIPSSLRWLEPGSYASGRLVD